jgi:hypothetical protein
MDNRQEIPRLVSPAVSLCESVPRSFNRDAIPHHVGSCGGSTDNDRRHADPRDRRDDPKAKERCLNRHGCRYDVREG